jgi:hypothetical protein
MLAYYFLDLNLFFEDRNFQIPVGLKFIFEHEPPYWQYSVGDWLLGEHQTMNKLNGSAKSG